MYIYIYIYIYILYIYIYIYIYNLMFIIPWSAQTVNTNGNILQRYFTHKNPRGTNNCVQCVFENIYFIMRFSPIFNCFSSMKG